jgi:nickel/cobalt transporter (NicO) family protein
MKKAASHSRPFLHFAILATCIAILLVIAGSHSAWAQTSPFGGLRPPSAGGIGGWLIAKQAIFYRALAGLIRSAKNDGSAFWGLIGISFVYGIFTRQGRATARR